MTAPGHPWRIPVRLDDVPEDGLQLAVPASEEVRAHLAGLAGVHGIPRLEASIEVTRHGRGLRAAGRVRATVAQSCVVTLDPMEIAVDETFDVTFAPAASGAGDEVLPVSSAAARQAGEADDPPEVLVDGTADLGAIVTEFLLLGIDPYPRKPGAVFTPPAEPESGGGPFAALARFKAGGGAR
jgi:uncharacterized metal-binding protein YceD (DUF177 family)